MDDRPAQISKKKIHIFWLLLFIPVAVGIHHFYFPEDSLFIDTPSPNRLELEPKSQVDVNIAELQNLVDQSVPDSERVELLDDLILKADQTIVEADQILARSNFDLEGSAQEPSDKTIELREQISTLTAPTL